MPTITAFIFDLDGTLYDSVPTIIDTMRLVSRDYALNMSDDDILATIGVPLVVTGEKYLGAGRGAEFAAAYGGYFRDSALAITAFGGIPELLARLKEQGARLALCTSKRRAATEDALRLSGLGAYLDAVVCCESTEEHKPLPAPALCAAALLQTAPERCLFAGDSVHDIACGKAAGMSTCGVTWGANTAEQLAAAGADYLVENTLQLEQLLLSLLN